MEYEQLKLKNQVCFPIYAASRLVIREYQPLLDKLGITYPQYLVMMVLWEQDNISINEITEKLILNTNTITPLLKRMEAMGLITRERSKEDERKVIVKLTKKGNELKEPASKVPEALLKKINYLNVDLNQLIQLKDLLNSFINSLNKKGN